MRTDERRKDFIRPQLGKGRCGVCWRRGRGGGSIGPKRPRKPGEVCGSNPFRRPAALGCGMTGGRGADAVTGTRVVLLGPGDARSVHGSRGGPETRARGPAARGHGTCRRPRQAVPARETGRSVLDSISRGPWSLWQSRGEAPVLGPPAGRTRGDRRSKHRDARPGGNLTAAPPSRAPLPPANTKSPSLKTRRGALCTLERPRWRVGRVRER